MKILVCANHFGEIHNGPAKFANLLLQAGGDDRVHVLTSDQTPSAFEGDPRLHRVRCRIPPSAPFFLVQYLRGRSYVRGIRKLLADQSFAAIVFINSANILSSTIRLGIPIIGMINDDKNLSPEIFRNRSRAAYLGRLALGWSEKRAARRADHIISNSRYLGEKISRIYGVPPERISHLYKAVDLTEINFQPPEIPQEGEVRILFVKSDYQIGGLPDLVAALRRLAPRRFHLRAIGPRQDLAARYREQGVLGDNTHLEVIGRLSQSDVFAEMRKTHLFCVPSHREALGVANIEAMAHGLPVVTSTTGGIPEVTDNGRTAWAAPAGDVAALTEALRDCLDRTDERVRKQQDALLFIHDHFTPAAAYGTLLRIVGGVVTNQHS